VDFVNKVVERGYAYVHEGSVYFDTRAFDSGRGHTSSGEDAEWKHVYAKLEPWSRGNRALMEEGEGRSSVLYAYILTHSIRTRGSITILHAICCGLCALESLQTG